MKTAWTFVIGVFFFSFFVQPALAAMEMIFSALPGSVDADNQFGVTVSLTDAPKLKKYYLRAALFESGKTSYFGYTFNHLDQWHNQPGEYLKYLEIATNDQGSWSGQLKAKADLSSGYFKGGGEYQFKIGRYTEGGSLSWSNNEAALVINYANQSNDSPSPSPNPTTSSSSQTTVSPSPIPTPSASPQPSKIFRIKDIILLQPETPEPVLGTSSGQTSTSPQIDWPLAVMFLVVGAGLLLATTIIMIRLWRKN